MTWREKTPLPASRTPQTAYWLVSELRFWQPKLRRIAVGVRSAGACMYKQGMFGRWLKSESPREDLSGGDALSASIERELAGADAETVLVVTSITGLLGIVAYADRHYSTAEEARVRQELGRVQGMAESGVNAICNTLRQHIVEISAVQMPRYARALRELGDEELRREVLGALIDLAAADESISLAETNLLRQITKSLGLSQQDYVELQERHRHHLAAIKR